MQTCQLWIKRNEKPYQVSIMAQMITFEGRWKCVAVWTICAGKTPDGFLPK